MKIGVIGCGKWGINHLRSLKSLEEDGKCEVTVLIDSNDSKKEIADEFNVEFYTSIDEAIDKADAFSVVVPTEMHYKIAKKLLEARKHVLVEKPLTLKVKESEELLDLATKNNLILQCGYLFRFNNSLLKLKEILKDAGDINYVTARFIHSSKPPRKDMGVILNFASHLIDTMIFLFGKPKKVFCKKVNIISKEREDSAIITLDYEKFIVNLEVSWLHPLKKRDIWIIADNKKIYAELLEQRIEVHPIKINIEGNIIEDSYEIKLEKNQSLKDELSNFINSIKDKSIGDISSALEVDKICEACIESANQNKEVNIK